MKWVANEPIKALKGIDMNPQETLTDGIGFDLASDTITTGVLSKLSSAATALTSAARLLLMTHTGASTVSGVLAEFLSAAADETVIVQIKGSAALALGVALNVSVAAMTTGLGYQCTDNTALTSGKLMSLATSATAMTSAGRIFKSDHTGATSTSGVLNEFASAANDETVIVKITASDLLAAGKALFVSCAAMTTGIAVDISGSVATTTGTLLNINDNSADTGTRSLVTIKQDHASASGATPLTILNDNATKPLIAGTATATSTNFFKFATVNGVTIWMGNGNTPASALSGTSGDVLFGGDSGKIYFCTGTTNWTSTT